jgi:hypothetical protein
MSDAGPPEPRQRWRTFDQISALFDGPTDPDWEADRDLVDQSVRDPWAD